MAKFKKGEEFLGFMMGALILLPFLIYYSFDGLKFIDHAWLGDYLPKVKTDFQKMEQFYGEAAAQDYQRFFFITVMVNLAGILVIMIAFLRQINAGDLHTGFGPIVESGKREVEPAYLLLIILFVCDAILMSLIWCSSILINKPDFWGIVTIQSGLRGQIVTVILFSLSSYLTPALIAEFINSRRNRGQRDDN